MGVVASARVYYLNTSSLCLYHLPQSSSSYPQYHTSFSRLTYSYILAYMDHSSFLQICMGLLQDTVAYCLSGGLGYDGSGWVCRPVGKGEKPRIYGSGRSWSISGQSEDPSPGPSPSTVLPSPPLPQTLLAKIGSKEFLPSLLCVCTVSCQWSQPLDAQLDSMYVPQLSLFVFPVLV